MFMAATVDKILYGALFLLILVMPSQHSLKLAGAHITPADPLILACGLLYGLREVMRCMCTSDACPEGMIRKFRLCASRLLPPPENMILLAILCASVFKAQDRRESIKEILQMTAYVAVLFVVFMRTRFSERALRCARMTLSAAFCIVAATALVQYFSGPEYVLGVRGTFANRNTYGGFLAVMLPLVFANLANSASLMERLAWVVMIAAGMVALLSGGALLGILCGSGAVLALGFSDIRSSIVAMAACILLFCALQFLLPLNNMAILYDSIRLYDKSGQIEPRYSEWQASMQLIEEEPILGVGAGNYQSQIGMSYGFVPQVEGCKEPDTQNMYLVFASSCGLAGFLGLGMMLLLWLRRLCFANFAVVGTEERVFALAAIGAVVAFSVASVWTALLVRGVFPLLVVLVALALNRENQGKQIDMVPDEKIHAG